MKKRILFISEYFPPYIKGGAEISNYLIAKELSKSNQIYVLTSNFINKNWILNSISIFPRLKRISISKGLFYNLFYLPSLIKFNIKEVESILKLYNVDLVHVIPSSFHMIPLIDILIKMKKPINVDIRDYSLMKYPKSNRVFFKYFINLYQSIIFKFYTNKLKKYKKIKFVTISNFIKQKLIDKGYPEEKIVVIPNISESVKREQIKRENKISFAGRIENEKGIWDAIKAFELLKNKNLIFEIAGVGTEFDNIKDYLYKNKIKNIKLLGKLANEAVLKLYFSSKIIIAPSVWPEPFGRFIQEGISTRTPVIATRVGGIPEGIKDHETGLLVKPNNPKQLAKAIKELLTDKQLYNKIVKNLEKEVDKYSPEKIGNQRMKVYEELIKLNKDKK